MTSSAIFLAAVLAAKPDISPAHIMRRMVEAAPMHNCPEAVLIGEVVGQLGPNKYEVVARADYGEPGWHVALKLTDTFIGETGFIEICVFKKYTVEPVRLSKRNVTYWMTVLEHVPTYPQAIRTPHDRKDDCRTDD